MVKVVTIDFVIGVVTVWTISDVWVAVWTISVVCVTSAVCVSVSTTSVDSVTSAVCVSVSTISFDVVTSAVCVSTTSVVCTTGIVIVEVIWIVEVCVTGTVILELFVVMTVVVTGHVVVVMTMVDYRNPSESGQEVLLHDVLSCWHLTVVKLVTLEVSVTGTRGVVSISDVLTTVVCTIVSLMVSIHGWEHLQHWGRREEGPQWELG